MVAKQRIRMANEKHSKNITQRGNVAKTLVSDSRRRELSDRKRKSTQWVPGCLPSLYLWCVAQQYFRSSRVSAWECDPQARPGPPSRLHWSSRPVLTDFLRTVSEDGGGRLVPHLASTCV
ncbi:stress-associated endoplasmic reticulum protein 2 isoform X1 [Nerophis ophidion]|uniref:stress-associated endoplasmic reticulum protein 2 isoform X1 n=1 Tax=Nerophis ophidion TaxID=159077 RepID=UPI002AE055E0|nr:stress-associated endoplasmic reticulum protein 2 isoform X1 [Nerophis ophidion]